MSPAGLLLSYNFEVVHRFKPSQWYTGSNLASGRQSQTIEPTYQGPPASASRLLADRGPVSVVDRLKTTESISQGGRSIRFIPDIMNGFCMRQTAKLQYHCYRISEIDSSPCSSVCYTGNKALARLTNHAAPMSKEVRSIFHGSRGRQVQTTEPIRQGARAPGCYIPQINNRQTTKLKFLLFQKFQLIQCLLHNAKGKRYNAQLKGLQALA